MKLLLFLLTLLFSANICFAGADGTNYKDCFINAKVIETSDGLRIDTPFQLYHQTICYQNSDRYCYLTRDLADKEVLVYIHYAVADEDKVKKFEGYLGDDWKETQKNPDAIKNWSVTKADAFAVTDVLGNVTKYKGKDADKVVHPYAAEEL